MLLQSIADVTMLLPLGSAVQQMAIRCFCLKFRQSDHQFLHESHVFSNISQILSKSDELMEQGNGELPKVREKVSVKQKVSVFEHAQNEQIHVILHMRRVLSGHLLSIATSYSVQ